VSDTYDDNSIPESNFLFFTFQMMHLFFLPKNLCNVIFSVPCAMLCVCRLYRPFHKRSREESSY
jgi:hypothetical protein